MISTWTGCKDAWQLHLSVQKHPLWHLGSKGGGFCLPAENSSLSFPNLFFCQARCCMSWEPHSAPHPRLFFQLSSPLLLLNNQIVFFPFTSVPDPFLPLLLLPSWSLPLLWICRLWFFSDALGDVTAFGIVLSMKKLYPELRNLTWLPGQQGWIVERISVSGGFSFMAVTDYLCLWHFFQCRCEQRMEKAKDE